MSPTLNIWFRFGHRRLEIDVPMWFVVLAVFGIGVVVGKWVL